MSVFDLLIDTASDVAAEVAEKLPTTGAGTLGTQIKIFAFGATAIGAEAEAVLNEKSPLVAVMAVSIGVAAAVFFPEAILATFAFRIAQAALPMFGGAITEAALVTVIKAVSQSTIGIAAESAAAPALETVSAIATRLKPLVNNIDDLFDDSIHVPDPNGVVNGTIFSDILVGDDQANAIFASGGDDTIIASAGIDGIYGGSGSDTVDYSALINGVSVDARPFFTAVTKANGTDYLSDVEVIKLTAHDDSVVLRKDTGLTTLHDSGGNNTVTVEQGVRLKMVKDGNADSSTKIVLQDETLSVQGLFLNKTLFGHDLELRQDTGIFGSDVLITLKNQYGAGGLAADVLEIRGTGNKVLHTINLAAIAEDAIPSGVPISSIYTAFAASETINGHAGNIVYGSWDGQREFNLFGYNGPEYLFGLNNDQADTLIGGYGKDILQGGTGGDTYVWEIVSTWNEDTIFDTWEAGDKIDLGLGIAKNTIHGMVAKIANDNRPDSLQPRHKMAA